MACEANAELAGLDYDKIHYFVRAGEKPQNDWDAVPAEIKKTFERLGIPEAERKFLAGVRAQFESEVVYGSLREDLVEAGRDLHRHRHGAPRVPRDRPASTSARSFRRPTTSSPR